MEGYRGTHKGIHRLQIITLTTTAQFHWAATALAETCKKVRPLPLACKSVQKVCSSSCYIFPLVAMMRKNLHHQLIKGGYRDIF